jgi:hypothetical protein
LADVWRNDRRCGGLAGDKSNFTTAIPEFVRVCRQSFSAFHARVAVACHGSVVRCLDDFVFRSLENNGATGVLSLEENFGF